MSTTTSRGTASRVAPTTPLAMAEWAIEAGLWPVVIHPYNSRTAKNPGKQPIGNQWGVERPDIDSIRATFRRYPKAGVGLKLGAEGGVIDIDVDQPGEARETLAWLFPGEPADTLKWANAGGKFHILFRYDARLAALGKTIIKGVVKPGGEISGNPAYAGLEVRIGAAPGSPKQVQTVIPPSCMTNGAARRWVTWGNLLALPEYVVEDLLINGRQAEPTPPPDPASRPRPEPVDGRWTPEARAIAYLQKCDPAISRQGGHDQTIKVCCKTGPGFDLPENTAFVLINHYWNPRCEPPWSGPDLSRKVSEAYKVETRRGWMFDGDGASSGTYVGPGPSRKPRPDPEPAGPRLADLPPEDGGSGGGEAHADHNPENLPRFGNHHVEEYTDGEGRKKFRPVPHPLPEIVSDLAALSPGWPKRVQERLFVESEGREPVYLGSATRLFSWIDQQSHVDWTKGSRFITQERFYENRRMNAERYESIEVMPHVPPMPGAYYMHRDVPRPSGKLDELVAKFLPATDEDRQFIKSLIVTPLWGGMPGTRPAFLVTGPDNDPEQGRGLGKSTMLDLISNELYGGSLDISPNEEIGTIKTRILSEEGAPRRILRLDNLKTLRFSWADLECMITSPAISGRMLYVGEGQRRNDFVWIITLNGASLSKDMAQRVVTIKLARPKRKPAEWRDETAAFMRENRWEIFAEIASILASEPGPMNPTTRWAAWERDILSKLDDPWACQRTMTERQDAVDHGNEDRDTVRDALCARMSAEGIEPDRAWLKIPSRTMAEIVSEAMRKHFETSTSTTFVKGLGIFELTQIRREDFRGWMWRGQAEAESDCNLFAPPPPRKP